MGASILDTMVLLNEAASRHPDAISFLAGRPPDEFVDASVTLKWTQRWIESQSISMTHQDHLRLWMKLGQYSHTSGVVLREIASYLTLSGMGRINPEDCMVTNGAQEAILIVLAALSDDRRSVASADPTYAGLAGAAAVLGRKLETFHDEYLVQQLEERLRNGSSNIGCLYVIPDFANPTSRVMSLADRLRLVELAEQHDFFIIEDAAYRRYRYEGKHIPTLFSLDSAARVVYVESFAKTALPGLRTSILSIKSAGCPQKELLSKLIQVKSYVSVTSSPLTQAALAGFLLEQGSNMGGWMQPRIDMLRTRRDAMLGALKEACADHRTPIQSWTTPEGGFFLLVETTMDFGSEEMKRCAEQSKVLTLPMQFFSTSREYSRQIRLSFSNVNRSDIEIGIARLAKSLRER